MWFAIFGVGFVIAIYKALREPVFSAMAACYAYFAIPMREFYWPDLRYQLVFNTLAVATAFRYAGMHKGWAREELHAAGQTVGDAALSEVRDDLEEALIGAAVRGDQPGDVRWHGLNTAEDRALETVMKTAPSMIAVAVRRAVQTALESACEAGEREAFRVVEAAGPDAPIGSLRGAMKTRVSPVIDETLDETLARVMARNIDNALDTAATGKQAPGAPWRRLDDEPMPRARGPLAGLLSNAGLWLHILFVLLTFIGATLTELNPYSAWGKFDTSWKLLIPLVAIICSVRTDRHFRLFTYAWMFGVWHLCMNAVRFWVSYGGRADDIGGQGGEANFLGAITVTVAPIAFGLFLAETSRARRAAVGFVAACYGLGVLACGSRGAMMALAMSSAYWLAHTSRKMIAVSLATAAVGAFLFVAPDSFWERMGTVLNPKGANPYVRAEEDGSKGSRKVLWALAIEIWKDNPWLGIGPQQYTEVSAEKTEFRGAYSGKRGLMTHNTWLQILSEYGAIGFGVWTGAFVLSMLCFRLARRKLRDYPSHAWFRAICLGFEAGALGNAIAITFQSFQWYDYMYWHFVFGPLALQIATDTKERLDWLKPIEGGDRHRPRPRYAAASPGKLDLDRFARAQRTRRH